MTLEHNREFEPRHGEAVPVASGVLRVTANNPSAFTFHGTNTYVVGTDDVAVIDPGPDDPVHIDAVIAAVAGRPLRHILATHTHIDHTPGTARLQAALGGVTCGAGPHRPARARASIGAGLDAGGDTSFQPEHVLCDGSIVEADGYRLEAIATPGHAANHLAFALVGSGVLFSGDHVMGWSTTVVAPPDGAMADYMRSLDALIARREDSIYLPGHGGPVTDPRRYVPALKSHRLMRERAILGRLAAGDRDIPAIVARLYASIDPKLHRAAGLSVLAHLEDLADRGLVTARPYPASDAHFEPAV